MNINKILNSLLFAFWLCAPGAIAFSSTNSDSIRNNSNLPANEAIVDSLNELAWQSRMNNQDEALQNARQSLHFSRRLNYLQGEYNAAKTIGGVFYLQSKLDSANFYYEQTLRLAQQMNRLHDIATAYYNLGNINFYYGKYDSSLVFHKKSLNTRLKLLDLRGMAYSSNVIGAIYHQKGNWRLAIDYYFTGMRLSDFINDKSAKAYAATSIGNLYDEKENFEEALKYYKQALTTYSQLNDSLNIAHSYRGLGLTNQKLGNYTLAASYYKKMMRIGHSTANSTVLASANMLLGSLYGITSQSDSAFFHLDNALKMYLQLDDKHGIASVYSDLSSLYYQQNDYEKAIELALRAEEISKKYDILRLRLETSDLLHKAYAKTGNFEKAYLFSEKYNVFNDSVKNTQNTRKIAQLEMAYNFEKERETTRIKQAEADKVHELELAHQKKMKNSFIVAFIAALLFSLLIFRLYRAKKTMAEKLEEQKQIVEQQHSLLQQTHAKIKAKNNELSAKQQMILQQHNDLEKQKNSLQNANLTKDKFFSIIAHDLRNPFNNLLNLSQYLLKNSKNISYDEILQKITQLHQSVKSTFTLLENLLNWSRSQLDRLKIEPQIFSLEQVMNNNIALYQSAIERKNFEIETRIVSNSYVYADFNTVNTIVRNLLSNAIKFTPIGGRIVVNIENQTPDIIFTIENESAIIPVQKRTSLFVLDKIQTEKGTSNESGTGLGLVLCKDFIERNNGRIWIEEARFLKGNAFKISLLSDKKSALGAENNLTVVKQLQSKKETAENLQLTEKEWDNLPQILEVFAGDYLQLITILKKHRRIRDIAKTGEKFIQLGEKYPNRIVVEYGKALVAATSTFNIDKINKILDEYNLLVQRLQAANDKQNHVASK